MQGLVSNTINPLIPSILEDKSFSINQDNSVYRGIMHVLVEMLLSCFLKSF